MRFLHMAASTLKKKQKKNMKKTRIIGLKKKKKKKTARIGLCDLPDEILVSILSLLPTKSAVATSLLSRRWHYLWTFITNLELRGDMFKKYGQFINFMDRAMALRKGSSLESVSLCCRVDYVCHVNAWITSAIQCNVEKLALDLYPGGIGYYYVLPGCLFDCQSLLKLDLTMRCNILRVPLSSRSVFSNLKCLSLHEVKFVDDESAEKLLSSPLLEELSIKTCYWDNVRAIRVSTPKLKVLKIIDYSLNDVNRKVCFVANNLWSFCYAGSLYSEYQICSSSAQFSTAKIVVPSRPYYGGIVVDANRCLKLINGLSRAHSLTLNDLFLQALERIRAKVDTLPIFKCLTQLNLECPSLNAIRLDGIVLTKIFERSPHLETLNIEELSNDVFAVPAPVLMCFQTHLKRIYIGDFTYHEGKEDAISVLLNSCAVLEEMVINRLTVCGMSGTRVEIKELLQNKLNRRPRVSKNCKIVLKHAEDLYWGLNRRGHRILFTCLTPYL